MPGGEAIGDDLLEDLGFTTPAVAAPDGAAQPPDQPAVAPSPGRRAAAGAAQARCRTPRCCGASS